jgi:hypothetical protein
MNGQQESMSTSSTTPETKLPAQPIPEQAVKETMPAIEPLQMSQIDMLKIAPTRDERLFLVLSIFIGIISGLLVVSFRIAISWVQTLTLGSAPQAGLLRLLFVPTIMGAVVAALVQFFFPAARGTRNRRRLFAGAGGPLSANRRRRCLGDQPQNRHEPPAAAAVCAGGRRGRTGSGLQCADLGHPVCD